MEQTRNPVERAIAALGGPTRTTVKTGVSQHTWNKWRIAGRIANPRVVLDVAKLTGIDPYELCGPPPLAVNQ